LEEIVGTESLSKKLVSLDSGGDLLSLQLMPSCPDYTHALPSPYGSILHDKDGPNQDFSWDDHQQFTRIAHFFSQLPAWNCEGWDEFRERAIDQLSRTFDPWLSTIEAKFSTQSLNIKPLDYLARWLKQKHSKLHVAQRNLAQNELLDAFVARREQDLKRKAARHRADSVGLRLFDFVGLSQHGPDWLVDGFVVRGQPAVIGGPVKTLKTSISLDLAIGLASGTHFLGYFDVAKPARVAIFSGESGDATLAETGQRIATAKGLRGVPTDVLICTRIPRLAAEGELELLRYILEDARAEVVIIDPLYLSLLDGATGLNPASMFDIGPLLRRLSEICLEIGCTPILVHHSTKNIEPGRPLQLPDLAFAGFAEFCRQWCLLNARKPFDAEKGLHRLLMSYGGSAGHSGVVAVDVLEGKLGSDFSGRVWEVTVSTWQEARLRDHDARVQARGRDESEKRGRNARRLMDAFSAVQLEVGSVTSYTKLRNAAGLDNRTMQSTLPLLLEEGVLKELAGTKTRRLERLK
jgi:replicative DNA helicase